ncbi:MAG: hypothetical protein AB7T06_39790 [Kofleriaceae bacterium]
MTEQKPKRRGNPNWIAGGPSPNPAGRPRSGLALAERIRERLTPDQLIDLVGEALANDKIDIEKRVSLAMQLASYGYSRPASGLDLNVNSGASTAEGDWSKVPLDVRREEFARRKALLARYSTERSDAHAGAAPDDESTQATDPKDESPTT